MDRIVIEGGRPLRGEIQVSGSKNAALPLMAASLLTEETLVLRNLPRLVDIATMSALLQQHGAEVAPGESAEGAGQVMAITARGISSTVAPYDLVRKMRASVLVLGPLVAREGHAEVSLPGGCAIGARSVDQHLKGLEALGARIELVEGYIKATAAGGLAGGEVYFDVVSVGATENLLMAACLAKGGTRLVNCAREPEIADLAECLQRMGAKIDGAGTSVIEVEGGHRLSGAVHEVIADRIEAGTFLMAAGITDGDLHLLGARGADLARPIELLGETGMEIAQTNQGLRAKRANGRLVARDVVTDPFPGFPTDLQAQYMALMSLAEGSCVIDETIFENRFMHVPELGRMGADITVKGHSATVRGVEKLKGAPVMASDLRASASLILAGLAAEGSTLLSRVYHLDRGYEAIERKLSGCGASIWREPEPKD